MTAMTRGHLPARVYWTRRAVVLAVLAGLLVGGFQLVRLATGGSPTEPDRAAQMAAEPSETPSDEPLVDQPERSADTKQGRERRKKRKNEEPALAEPEGECDDRDIAVTPTVDEAVGGSPITFVLELRSVESPACTWQVSPRSVTVKVTSGKDDIWSSVECPRAIPWRDVVVRNNVSTEVEVNWSARRSDEECSRNTDWAMPGWYFVKAAALAGEPSDLHFEVTTPEPDVVTETVKPKDRKRDGKTRAGRSRERDRG